MNKIKNFVFLAVALTMPIISIISVVNAYSFVESAFIKYIIIGTSIVAAIMSVLLRYRYNSKLYKLFFLLTILFSLFIMLKTMLHYYQLDYAFSSITNFKEFILSTGQYGMITFVILQFLQVMFLPIPSMIITLAGVAVYGPVMGSILCITGILTASYCSFGMGKIFGYRIVSWIAGEKATKKYADILNRKGRFFLFVAFLLPLFPDDILCMVAGITTMSFKTFFIIATITRPIGVVCMSYFGGGYIVPFSGWGLYVWPFLLAFIIFSIIMIYKNQTKIENYIFAQLDKLKTKKPKL